MGLYPRRDKSFIAVGAQSTRYPAHVIKNANAGWFFVLMGAAILLLDTLAAGDAPLPLLVLAGALVTGGLVAALTGQA